MTTSTAPTRVVTPTRKHPDEVLTFTFPFAPIMAEGKTLAQAELFALDKAPALNGPWESATDLNFGAWVVSGTDAQSEVTDGAEGSYYRVQVKGTDNSGENPIGTYYFVIEI